jgi:hypothetical protein
MPLVGYKLSGRGQEPGYASMAPGFAVAAEPAVVSTRAVNDYSRLPPAPKLNINTDFRSQVSIPLPMVPPAYNFNYGFPAGKSGVSSLTGAIPQYDTPLSKIGPGNYPILEPVNLFPNLRMRC